MTALGWYNNIMRTHNRVVVSFGQNDLYFACVERRYKNNTYLLLLYSSLMRCECQALREREREWGCCLTTIFALAYNLILSIIVWGHLGVKCWRTSNPFYMAKSRGKQMFTHVLSPVCILLLFFCHVPKQPFLFILYHGHKIHIWGSLFFYMLECPKRNVIYTEKNFCSS